MSYKIIYHTETKSHFPRLWLYGAAALLLFGCLQWQGLLPESTAVSNLIHSLQAGQDISEAVGAFCQALFSHGQ